MSVRHTQGFMCPCCYNTFTIDYELRILGTSNEKQRTRYPYDIVGGDNKNLTAMCPICVSRMVPIDIGILDQITELNNRGFYTIYCCEGHCYNIDNIRGTNDTSLPYVLFDSCIETFNKNRILEETAYIAENFGNILDIHDWPHDSTEIKFRDILKVSCNKEDSLDPVPVYDPSSEIRIGLDIPDFIDINAYPKFVNNYLSKTFCKFLSCLVEGLY